MNSPSNDLPPVPESPVDDPSIPVGVAVPEPPQADQSVAHLPVGMPAMADDADLIEKEWVEKAKQILSETRDNPFVMNQQMTAMKTDYLKKRYNKDVKAP